MPVSPLRRRPRRHELPPSAKLCCLLAFCQIHTYIAHANAASLRATVTAQSTSSWKEIFLSNSYGSASSSSRHGALRLRAGVQAQEGGVRALRRQDMQRLVTLRTDPGQHSKGSSGGRKRRKHQVLSVATLSVGHGPNRQCAAGCTKHGVCNEELGRCDCPRGWSGLDCSQAPTPEEIKRVCAETHFFHYRGNCTDEGGVPEPYPICVNGCNNRGTCRAGWCQCQPGYWGADCSLSMGPNGKPAVLAGMGYALRKKKPSVYIYDLPHRLTSWRNPTYSDRPLHIAMWHRLLGAGCVTTDGDQADYFYFPVSVRGPSEGLLLEAAINYVRTYWPYWDRYQGARHLVIHTGDTGRAELTNRTLIMVTNSTFLTHWGLTKNYPSSGWRASHIENRDVVIPIHMAAMGARSSGLQVSPLHPRSGADQQPKDKDSELIFAGRICGGRDEPDGTKVPNCKPASKGYSQGVRQMGFSQGVRQLIHQHHWNRTGFNIAVSIPNYFERLTKTRFCLAPTGGGHGHRQILVAFSGCTPLVISDYVLQPFEPAMNWTRFSVTLPQSTIPDLHNILPAISAERYDQMQAALPCAAQHFAWSTSTGSFMNETGKYDAFETTMEILRMMRKYPGVPHKEYETMDPEFKAFMECRSDDYYALSGIALQNQQTVDGQRQPDAKPITQTVGFGGNDTAGVNALCSLSKWDGAPCEKCLLTHRRTVPGGALCCQYVDNLAACPRLWE